MSMGGGGGSSGGAVVGGPTPEAAMYAGILQSQAAQVAAQQAAQATNDALSAISRQYLQARADVQPYRTEGVQALNQLNQYLGLNPYNPGNAPEAPTVTSSMIKNYVGNNYSQLTRLDKPGNAAVTFSGITPRYTGYIPTEGVTYSKDDGTGQQRILWNGQNTGLVKVTANPKAPKMINGQENVGRGGILPNGIYAAGSIGGGTWGDYSALSNNPTIQAWVKQAIQNDPSLDANYQSQLDAYKQNLPEWEQNKAMYDKYMAEGPYTSQQITDKITNLPGYQAELQQGYDAIGANAAAKGYVGSGRILRELGLHGQNTLSTFYNNELNRLAGLAGMGANAAGASADQSIQTGSLQGQLNQMLGDTKANSVLASGNALAQAILSANQQYKIIGGDSGGGGGLGGIGSILGGIGSIMSSMPSSKKLKTKIKSKRSKSILKKFANLDVDEWKYHDNVADGGKHIGPYAEDFKKAFGIGDGKSIDVISYLGVLTGSIKELAKQALENENNAKSRKVVHGRS